MNEIHPTAIIEGDVELGEGNVIGPYCILKGPLRVGDDNQIGPHVCIGTPGQDTRNPRYDSSECRIEIGSRNIFREFTAIQKPCYRDITRIHDDVFLMQSVHIPHDAILEDKVVITPMCVLGGIAHVMVGATLGMGCSVHQYSVIGAYSIVATNSAVIKNIRPFSRHIPNRPISVNTYAIDKFGFGDEAEAIEAWVLNDDLPPEGPARTIIDRWIEMHEASGRRQYR